MSMEEDKIRDEMFFDEAVDFPKHLHPINCDSWVRKMYAPWPEPLHIGVDLAAPKADVSAFVLSTKEAIEVSYKIDEIAAQLVKMGAFTSLRDAIDALTDACNKTVLPFSLKGDAFAELLPIKDAPEKPKQKNALGFLPKQYGTRQGRANQNFSKHFKK